ncbi:DEBR0S4_07030g1_1 [Brettanomyces bruxellensis]|uniref:DEBR0S4_07030g1_1 n=1 Tax=Dekkera bruxellensis TaxID=5007 RepID=A0A7D9H108_DEKBR|nr:DEBR0S4_07030g1_1 [Brettanomyces bruxellensis]
MGILREPPNSRISPVVQIREHLNSQVYPVMSESAVPSAYLRRAPGPGYSDAGYVFQAQAQAQGRWPLPSVYGPQPASAYMGAPGAATAVPLPRMGTERPALWRILSTLCLASRACQRRRRAPSYIIGQPQGGYPGMAGAYAPQDYAVRGAQMFPVVRPKKRKRKKYNEVERFYKCNYKNCTKAYGTLNHLNCHIMLQKHGKKRLPSEFKELRERLKKRRRMQREKARLEKEKDERLRLEEEEKREEVRVKYARIPGASPLSQPMGKRPLQMGALPPPWALAQSPTIPGYALPASRQPLARAIPPLQPYRPPLLDASRSYPSAATSQYYSMYPGRALAQPGAQFQAQRAPFPAGLPPLRLSRSPRPQRTRQLGLAPVANMSLDESQSRQPVLANRINYNADRQGSAAVAGDASEMGAKRQIH